MAKVELKAPIVAEIAENIKDADSIVAVDYRGLTVDEDTRLRRSFREAGIEYKVYKNTLIKRAIAGTAFEPVTEILEGPTAIAISKEDATAPARVIFQNMKEMPKLEVKGGMVEDKYYDAAGMEQVSKIPSRDVLLGRLFGSMQSPIANLARVINQIAESKTEAA